jgi:lysozyme
MGTEGLLKFVNTLAYVRYGKYEEAAEGMLASKWARQTPERAARMAEQMRSGQWQQ